jgi:hypothetical protein
MTEQTQQTVLTLGDIATVVQLIDVVSRRGGIAGNEMAAVGALRNKLETYLNEQNPEGQQNQAQPEFEEMPTGPMAGKVIN